MQHTSKAADVAAGEGAAAEEEGVAAAKVVAPPMSTGAPA